MPNTYVNINTDNNIVSVESSNESIRIINNDSGATVNIVKVDRDVVRVNGIGPQGPQGADGGGINTGSLAITGSNTFIGNQIINGNLTVTGSLFATASYSTYAVTASYALNAAAGSQGTIGSQGTTGTSGTQGTIGIQGFNGTQGPLGAQGTAGAQGNSGAQGAQGTTGLNGSVYIGTSSTLLTIATGSQTLTVETGLAYTANQDATINYVSDPTNYHMHGIIQSYNSGTGNLVVLISNIQGAGSFNSWTTNLDGAVGAVGAQGATGAGSQGVQGSQGPLGPIGNFGSQGASGAQGRQGTIGAQGAQGTTGAQGTIGAQGRIGAQGTSAATSITNNLSGYVVTATSDSNTPFNGEENLTFDGTKLNIINGNSTQINIWGGTFPTNSFVIGSSNLTNNTRGFDNISIGKNALNYNTTGSGNVAVGHTALTDNKQGSYSTAVGHGALSNISGSYNTAVGAYAGSANGVETGLSAYSVYIGYNNYASSGDQVNQIVIGSNAVGNGSNTTVIGNSDTVSTQLFGSVTSSNARLAGIPVGTTQTRVLVSDTTGNIFYRTTVPSASIAQTASYVVTALSASYVNPLTQTLRVTGSVFGNVTALSIASNTASLNLTSGSFFTLQLVQGTNTYINPNSISPGLAVSLLISTTGSATVSFPATVFQPSGSSYTPTTTTGKDVLTLVSFDSTNLYLANVKNLI